MTHANPNPTHERGDNIILHIAALRGCEYIVKLSMALGRLVRQAAASQLRFRHPGSLLAQKHQL